MSDSQSPRVWMLVISFRPQQMTGWWFHSTHLKNISQIGNLPHFRGEEKNIWNQHLNDVGGDDFVGPGKIKLWQPWVQNLHWFPWSSAPSEASGAGEFEQHRRFKREMVLLPQLYKGSMLPVVFSGLSFIILNLYTPSTCKTGFGREVYFEGVGFSCWDFVGWISKGFLGVFFCKCDQKEWYSR